MSAHSDHEIHLRALLQAAAESLEPRSDGLQRIQARLLRQPPAAVRWAIAAWNEIFMRAPAAVQDACYWLANGVRVVWEQFERAAFRGRHRSSTQGWLRPATLMAAVMFIVAAGTYTAITASSLIFPSNSGSQSSSHTNPPAGHTSGPAPLTSSSRPNQTVRPKASATSSCTPPAAQTPAPSASPAASPTASPSASATPSASTSTDTSSPGDSSSPDPSASVTASPPPVPPPSQPPVVQPAATPCASS